MHSSSWTLQLRLADSRNDTRNGKTVAIKGRLVLDVNHICVIRGLYVIPVHDEIILGILWGSQ